MNHNLTFINDENEINRWVDTMTDRLDLALGRRL